MIQRVGHPMACSVCLRYGFCLIHPLPKISCFAILNQDFSLREFSHIKPSVLPDVLCTLDTPLFPFLVESLFGYCRRIKRSWNQGLPSCLRRSLFHLNKDLVLSTICPAPKRTKQIYLPCLDVDRALLIYRAAMASVHKTEPLFVLSEDCQKGHPACRSIIAR